jgi:hypothetical protein
MFVGSARAAEARHRALKLDSPVEELASKSHVAEGASPRAMSRRRAYLDPTWWLSMLRPSQGRIMEMVAMSRRVASALTRRRRLFVPMTSRGPN